MPQFPMGQNDRCAVYVTGQIFFHKFLTFLSVYLLLKKNLTTLRNYLCVALLVILDKG